MKNILKSMLYVMLLQHSLFGQVLNQDQQEFILNNIVPVTNDDNYQNSNWDGIVDVVKDKRLVFLGEFNHGSKEVFTTRNELIKVLHKELGFNLILFESGIGEVGAINLMINDLEKPSLTSGFFGGWRTSEFENLLLYAKENAINIGGFDVQRTGWAFTNYWSAKLENPKTLEDLESRFVAIKSQLSNNKTEYDSVNKKVKEIIDDYQSIQKHLDEPDELAIKTISNRIEFLSYMLDFVKTKDWNRKWMRRDSAMAENIKWLLKSYGPKQKAIIIAHNFHISRYNEKEEVMGEFLKEEFDGEMYVLGVFAKEGMFHNNYGKSEHLSPPDSVSLDIKHIIESDRVKMSFLDMPKSLVKGGHWLHEPIVVNDTFIDLSNSNKLILAKCFDGLLLLDAVTVPK